MNLFKLLFSIVALLISLTASYSQVFKGKVVDENRLAIPGAYVHNVSKNVHAHSDVNGNFELHGTQPLDSIDVSILGFGTVSFKVLDPAENQLIILKEKTFLIDEVVISGRNDALQQISNIDLRRTPVESSQEILRGVPGLFVAQHAGGGKAEQIFLRGFDIDHGTDVAISVDGMPVNMVSHAHGQGYSDLHFVIPETIEQIEYNKGPYYSEVGNFNTAGYVDFQLKKELDYNELGLDIGEFGYRRLLAMMNLVNKKNENLYVATEYQLSDGPFESSQNFNRLNVLTRYSTMLRDNSEISLTASHFSSDWDASGQIPERAVQSGLISRFGAIDDTEGGNTSRTNVALSYNKNLDDNNFITSQLFYSHYDFELYSNFTFFLENPDQGDRIVQKEDRHMFGFNSAFNHSFNLLGEPSLFSVSLGMRNDRVNDVELSNVAFRGADSDFIRLGAINELNTHVAAELEWKLNKVSIAPSLRLDNFSYSYKDKLVNSYNPLTDDALTVNPKLSVIYSPSEKLQLYTKAGIGFHSNDTRIALQSNTSAGFAPSALGVDVGMYFKPTKQIWTNLAFWYLNSEQEFVYVGDAGVVEASGESLRKGFDFSIRYQPLDKLYLFSDITYSNARSVDEDEGQDFVPLAPVWTGVLGANLELDRFNVGVNSRYLGDRAANEDNSVIAEGYFVMDANISFEHKRFLIGLSVDNLLDTDWNETQFLTESRLQNEAESVEEIHFTPGMPRFFKTRVRYKF